MPRDGDWDSFDEDARTIDEGRMPLPETTPTVRPPETTGRHKTLQGYVDQEVAVARARLDERQFMLMGLVLSQMSNGVHPDVARTIAIKFDMWLAEPDNARLIRAALKDAA